MLSHDSTMAEVRDQFARTAVYPQQHAGIYLTTGLLSEMGELANVVKKIVRGDKSVAEMAPRIFSEYGDVCWYAVMLSQQGDTRSLADVEGAGLSEFRAFLSEVDKVDDRPLSGNAVALSVHIVDALLELLDGDRDAITVVAELGEVISQVTATPEAGFGASCIEVADKLSDRQQRGVLRGDGDER